MSVIDQYSDPSFTLLHVLTKDRPLARQVLKTASFEEKTASSLPDSAFAWPELRKFPVHTKEDTVASLLYRTKIAKVPDYVDSTLEKAAEVWGVDITTQKTASQDEMDPIYALPEVERLPIHTPEYTKIAEEVLNRDRERLPMEKRAAAYQRLVTAANYHGVELEDATYKHAGLTACHRDALIEQVEARAGASYRSAPEVAEKFDKLASALRNEDNMLLDRKVLTKIASALRTLDNEANLDQHYDRRLKDPVESVFNGTEKLAGHFIDVGGSQVEAGSLMALPPEIWEQVGVPELGDIAASGDANEFSAVFETLPADIKVAIQPYVK